MKQVYAKQLLEKYKNGTCTPLEKELVEQWVSFGEFPEYSISEQQLESELNRLSAALPLYRERALWPKSNNYRIGAAAAVVAIIISAGIWFYQKNNVAVDTEQLAHQGDVAPGRDGATLTLSNGQKILINDALAGNIANESGVKISKTADGQIVYEVNKLPLQGAGGYNTLSTTRGEQTQVRLPDGTLVFLNAESSLKYPASFASLKTRNVELTGEGYFEVAKDKSHPFIVRTFPPSGGGGIQEVEVLGTHFNINAYADETTIGTTLLEGSVRIAAGGYQKVLKPGEIGLNNGNAIQVANANVENITDWKNGDFYLDRIDFKQAMRKIARWYNVELIYDADVPSTLESGGWISRKNKLSTVLKSIEKTGQVHFKIEGRKIYISK